MDKIRFGVVGTNFITDWVIEGAKQDSRFELAAVCSRHHDTATAFAKKHDIPHTFTSLDEMVSGNTVDAVYIASPNFMHASQSITCMSHGKHVLCEKPMASNAFEARKMIEASKMYDVTFMEAMKPTLLPNFIAIRNKMGSIGTIRRYFSSFCQYSSRYDKFKEGIVLNAFNPELSNGAIMDIGIYTIYPMVVLFGRPEKIIATGTVLSSGADGQGSAIFKYPGMEASVIYSKISDSQLPTEIQGEDATMHINHISKITNITYTPRAVNIAGGKGAKTEPIDISCHTDKNDYYYEIAEFIDLIQSGRRESEINSHNNSLLTMEIIDEIRRQIGVKFPADENPRVTSHP